MRKTLQAAWLGLLLLLPGVVLAQSATISGTVTDVDGEPVFGANVVLLEQKLGGKATGGASFTYGATSDIEGRYSFEVPASGVSGQTATLRASSLGYASDLKEITVTPGLQTHNFVLRYDAFNLDELVVTGVAEATPKKKLAFTVETVGAEQLERAPAGDPVSALAGKIAGASVVSGSGEPGSGPSILLRGITGINTDNSPLVIVDGVILADSQVDFDALDIESIEVVKGAAASSLYGSRAQAGVIQIRTKRGSGIPIGQSRVTVRNEIGGNFLPNRIQLSNSHPFALTADGSQFAAPDGSALGSDINAYSSAQYEGSGNVTFLDNAWPGTTYDHLDELIQPGLQYSNQIAVSQNTQSTNFRMSFTNYNQDGIVIGTDGYNRKSVRMNLDHKISPVLEVRGSGFYSQSEQDAIGDIDQNVFYDIYFNSPFVSLKTRDENGKIKLLADPKTTEENPLYAIEEAEVSAHRSRVTGNFTSRWSPVSWFDVAGSFSYDRSDAFNQEFYDIGYEAGGGFDRSGKIKRWNDVDEAINADLVANVRRDLGDMTLRAQGKVAIENFDSEYTFAQGSDLTVVDTRDLDNAAGSKTVSSSTITTRSEGYYITGGFDYKDRYIADVLFRRDGSSLFGPENRWNNYYRVSAAYRVSEESWFPAKDFIDEFKLRYSRGTAGGRPSFAWQYETFSLGGGIASKSRLGNPFLKPELQTEQEFGVEASFGGRLYAEVVYAMSEVKDQLIVVPLPAFSGYPNGQFANAGTVESNTIEASIDASLVQTRDYSVNMGLIFDRTRGKITEFDRPGYLTGFGLGRSLFFLRAGEDIGAIYGDQWIETSDQLATTYANSAGVNLDAFQKNDDGLFVPVGVGNSYKDMMWGTMVDINGDGTGDLNWGNPVKFTDEDGTQKVRIGSVVPDFNLGLNTTINYKGLSAYMLWNAQVGGDIYNGTRQWAYREDGVGGHHGDQDQAGKADDLKKPINYYQNLYNVNAPNSWFVEDGTYLKLREVSLRYTFDRAMLNKIGLGSTLNRIAVSAVGRNLLTFTDYSGFDPEVGSALYRVDHFVYPNFRTFTGVVEIEF